MADDKTVARGDGWAVSSLDTLGSGPGFRKIRSALGVEAFGVNAIVLPAQFAATKHRHETQEELYFVHSGTVSISIDDADGQTHTFDLAPGGIARVDAPVVRCLKNTGDDEAVVLVTGGKGGYVGRDGLPT
jgi:uncharacterized cupin superfamily protein